MGVIDFWIDCIPSNSSHQGSLTILKRRDGSQFVGKFASSKAKKWESEMLTLFAPHKPPVPFENPVSVECLWVFPWRKSETKKNRALYLEMPKGTRADLDNLFKGIGDCLTRLGFYKDDSLIYQLRLKKLWGDKPGIGIKVKEWEGI